MPDPLPAEEPAHRRARGVVSDRARFTFAQSLAESNEERANPWLLLNRRFDDGAIPAIADQTSLTYVFHLALGNDFVLTPEGREPVRLRIVATLADSVLQSELIIGESQFVRLFPIAKGYRVWMIETPEARADGVTTCWKTGSPISASTSPTRARVSTSYHQVENTYLSTFQALGALGSAAWHAPARGRAGAQRARTSP